MGPLGLHIRLEGILQAPKRCDFEIDSGQSPHIMSLAMI